MSRFATNSRDRVSKKYLALHERLRRETASPPVSDSSKQDRKRQASRDFRATGA